MGVATTEIINPHVWRGISDTVGPLCLGVSVSEERWPAD